MSECTSLDELQQATEPLTDYLANAGCLRPLKGIEDKDLLVEDILMFQVFHIFFLQIQGGDEDP